MGATKVPRVHFTVAGKRSSANFQRCRRAAESLAQLFPERFSCDILSLVSTDYELHLGGVVKTVSSKTAHKDSVVVTNENELVGGCEHFLRWAKEHFGYSDEKTNAALWTKLAKAQWRAYCQLSGHVFVQMSFQQGEDPLGSLLLELYTEHCPETCERFLDYVDGQKWCVTHAGRIVPHADAAEAGEAGIANMAQYKGTPIHRIVPDGYIQGGDLATGHGDGRWPELTFPDETFRMQHDVPGVVGMAALSGTPHSNCTQFYITLAPLPWLDGKRVAFGRVIEGLRVLKLLQQLETRNQRPVHEVIVSDCRRYTPP